MNRMSVKFQQHKQRHTYSVINSISTRFIDHVGTVEYNESNEMDVKQHSLQDGRRRKRRVWRFFVQPVGTCLYRGRTMRSSSAK